MTHREQFLQILKEAGVPYVERDYGEYRDVVLRADDQRYENHEIVGPIQGYSGFETTFSFSSDGRLAKVQLYE